MANEQEQQGYTIAIGPEQTNGFRLLALKSALFLETKGMKLSRGVSACTRVKREFSLKGNKESVLEQFEEILRDKGVLKVEIDPSAEQVHAKDIQEIGNLFTSVNVHTHDGGDLLVSFKVGGKTRINTIYAAIKAMRETFNEHGLWFQQGKGNTGHIFTKRNNHLAWVTFNK